MKLQREEQTREINPQTLYYEKLVAASDICEVAEELIPDSITVNNPPKLYCDCPNHTSISKESLHIDGEKQLWYCWGCSKGGNVIQLVEFLEVGDVSKGVKGTQPNSHRKARDYLAKRANLPPLSHSEPDPDQEEALERERVKEARTYECLTWISDYYNKKLEQNQEVLDWFSDNYAISSKTISDLQIGYSDNEGVLESLKSAQFSVEEIISTGSFIKSTSGVFSLFKNRVVFPYWFRGKGVVYMIGRKTPWTPDDKYESSKYKKLLVHNQKHLYVSKCINNSTLYNEDCLIRSPEMIVITEGVTDVIAAMERGFSAISPVTVRIKKTDLDRICGKLSEYSGKIVIVQDNELSKVGLDGALDSARELCKQGFDARIAELPLGDKQKKARAILQEKFSLDVNKLPEEQSNQSNKYIRINKEGEEEEIELLKKQSKIDINEYFKEGHSREEFQKILDESLTPIELLIANLEPNIKGLDIQSHLTEIISEISTLDPVKQEYYLKLINNKLPDTTSLGTLKKMMSKKIKTVKESSKQENSLNQLLGLFRDSGSTAFKDQLGEGWVTVKRHNHYENIKIRSTEFGHLMLEIYYRNYDAGVAKETIEQLGSLLMVRSTEERYLFNRYAWLGDRLLIDLGDSDWKVIEVSEEGWSIIQPDKSVFRRFRHQLPLPIPKKGGDIKKVFDYLSVKDEGNKALLLVWLCTCMLEHIPRPGIIFHGTQGSCKTSGADFIRLLVDPSSVIHSSLSKDNTQFIQLIDHHAVVSLDNISSLPPWACNTLCTAITGGGHTKRSLYTNDDDFPYSFRRVFILNGISVPTTAPDLLDRSLLIELNRLGKRDRKTMTKLKKSFEDDSPFILGQILDVLVYVISRRHEEFKEYSRLADWDGLAGIAAEKLNLKDEFLLALGKSEKEQNIEVVESHIESEILMDFMEGQGSSWKGPSADFYAHLTKIAEDTNRKKEWPKNASSLVKKLKRLSHNLDEVGIHIESVPDPNGKKRIISIVKKERTKTDEELHLLLTGGEKVSGSPVSRVSRVSTNDISGLQLTGDDFSPVSTPVSAVNPHDKKENQRSLAVVETIPPTPDEVEGWPDSLQRSFYIYTERNRKSGVSWKEADRLAIEEVKNSQDYLIYHRAIASNE